MSAHIHAGHIDPGHIDPGHIDPGRTDPRHIDPARVRSSVDMTDTELATRTNERVYKICPRMAWQRALPAGTVELSADDARDGYVHLSTAAQLRGTLDRHFAGQRELVLLELLVSSLPPGVLRWEASRGGQLFPHLYAPLEATLVARAVELAVDAAGRACLPAAFTSGEGS